MTNIEIVPSFDAQVSTGELDRTVDMPAVVGALVDPALTATWHSIRQHHPDVPKVVLTYGAGTARDRPGETRWGHFAANRWEDRDQNRQHELFVSGEALRLGAGHVLTTLLHEAAHGVATVRGIDDTSRQGRYHNARFKVLGDELGLTITRDGSNGWSGTELAPGTAQRYRAELDQLTAAITAYRRSEAGSTGGTGRGGKSNNLIAAECACPRKLRIARSTLDLGPFRCELCNTHIKESGK